MPDNKVAEADTCKDILIGFLITMLLIGLTWLAWGNQTLILILIGTIAVFLFLGLLSKNAGYFVWATWRFIVEFYAVICDVLFYCLIFFGN